MPRPGDDTRQPDPGVKPQHAWPALVCFKCGCRSYCVEHREESEPIVTCYRCGEKISGP